MPVLMFLIKLELFLFPIITARLRLCVITHKQYSRNRVHPKSHTNVLGTRMTFVYGESLRVIVVVGSRRSCRRALFGTFNCVSVLDRIRIEFNAQDGI